MKTGSHLKIKQFGDAVMGVRLEGNPQKPEPIYFRVVLPFGDVDIARCTDDTYWVHVRVNKDQIPDVAQNGEIIDGRVDVIGKHAIETSCGDLDNPDAYHVAVKIGPKEAK